MLKQFAQNAVRFFKHRNTYQENTVQVVSVEKVPNEDVYCLIADNTHSFALSNGVIVHNCYDAVRYRVLKGSNRMATEIKVVYPN